MPQAKVLVIDDDADVRGLLLKLLQGQDYDVEAVETGRAGLASFETQNPDLVFLDLYLPDLGGLEVLERLLSRFPDAQVVIMTGRGEVETAVRAMKIGALDYLLKPFDIVQLTETIRGLLRPDSESQSRSMEKRIIGDSPKMRDIWTQIRRYALPEVSILILGESGTGKELFAQAIHERSKRSTKPFVALDCATLPDTLVESEIFGHEKGAFTGALGRKVGKFEMAEGGTLFLDEIGNLPPHVQAKLLRVLQERYIERLGGQKPVPVDVRIVSATNLDLEQAIRKGTFREDLYYRLAEVALVLPPLREREGDILALANYFVEEFNKKFGRQIRGISDSALEILQSYRWPGNVRELENVIKSSLLASDDLISKEDLPEYLLRCPCPAEPAPNGGHFPKRIVERVSEGMRAGLLDLKMLVSEFAEEVEKDVLAEVLGRRDFTQNELSTLLRVDPKTLRSKLQKFNLRTR